MSQLMKRMGRTGRLRKKTNNFRRLDHDPDLISLNKWLSQNGTEWNKKLGYANFQQVGRGIVANRALSVGELLVDLPLSLTINITTVLLDCEFANIFSGYDEHQQSLTLQAVLAFYLVFLKQKLYSKWHIYIKSLPTEYTVPYFLCEELKKHLESSIRNIVNKQQEVIESSYKVLVNVLDKSNKHIQFSMSDYEWAYFTVNTRCVYMDLTDIVDLESIESPILNLIKDNLTIALCPYLDMINHSSNAKTQTKLKVTGTLTPLKMICENSLSKIRFHLYTMNTVKSYNEVYICYGDSHNLKLITEYGFYLPCNQLDAVHFDFETVKSCLASQNIKLSQDQCRFITSHNLCNGLYIDHSGLSFNFYALLTVLKCYSSSSSKNDISKVIYSTDETQSNRKSFNDSIMPLLNSKITDIKKCIANVTEAHESITLRNCVYLMQRYIDILKSIQK